MTEPQRGFPRFVLFFPYPHHGGERRSYVSSFPRVCFYYFLSRSYPSPIASPGMERWHLLLHLLGFGGLSLGVY